MNLLSEFINQDIPLRTLVYFVHYEPVAFSELDESNPSRSIRKRQPHSGLHTHSLDMSVQLQLVGDQPRHASELSECSVGEARNCHHTPDRYL